MPTSPFSYAYADEADRRRERRLGMRWLPMTVGILLTLVFIVITIINLFAAGLPNLATGSTAWQSDVAFPLIALPSWVTVPVGALPLLATVLLWRLVDKRHAAMVSNTILLAATVFLLMPVLLSGTYSEPSPFMNGARTTGWHWIAVPLVLVAIGLLIVRRVTLRDSPVSPAPVDPYLDEAVALRRRAQRSARARATLDADLAALTERRAAAGQTGHDL